MKFGDFVELLAEILEELRREGVNPDYVELEVGDG